MNGLSVLGVDFGTTKTYLSKCPAQDPSPVSIDFGDGRDGIPSAILYRKGRTPLIGQTALDEYGEATARERSSFRLVGNFKADLARSEEARAAAVDFLVALLSEARKQRIDLDPLRRRVLFGIPSEADDSFRAAMRQTAEIAGFGELHLVDEPKGALLYHMKQRDISVDSALGGVLVVDFGGGTCDFAFMERGRVVHSWGDMLLGGRLFDDLFFQWLCDQNPNLESDLESRGTSYYVMTNLCRDLKEFFSRSMVRDRSEKVSKNFVEYGKITNMTWGEFLRRGERYCPSRTFIRHSRSVLPDMRGRGHSSAYNFLAHDGDNPLPGREIDLFDWFRSRLLLGLRNGNIDRQRISLTILAGGSSQWPFVREILNSEVPPRETESIIRSDRPYAVIAMGISLLPALKGRFAVARHALQSELPDFIENKLGSLTTRILKHVEKRLASVTINVFFRGEVVPLLHEFRELGGSLAALQIRVDQRTSSAESVARAHLAHIVDRFLELLQDEVKGLMTEWFTSHGIAFPWDEVKITFPEQLAEPLLRVRTPAADGMLDVIGAAVGGFLATGTAMICGGSGAALITVGPIGLTAGALLGAAAGWVLLRYSKDQLRNTAERMNLPPAITSLLMSDRRIMALERDLEEALSDNLERRFIPVKQAMDEHIRALVMEEIKALNEVNSF